MKKQSTAKGFATLSLSGITIKLISLVFVPMILAVIGEEGNGLYSAANQVFAFVYVITNSGTLNAITKMISEYAAKKTAEDAEKAFRVSRIALGVAGGVFTVILLLVAKKLAALMQYEQAALSIMALAPSVFFTSIISGYRGYFQGMRDFKPRAHSQLLEQITHVLSSLGLAVLGMHMPGTAEQKMIWACAGANAGTTVAAFAAMLYLMYYMKKFRKNAKPHNLDLTEIESEVSVEKQTNTAYVSRHAAKEVTELESTAEERINKYDNPNKWYNKFSWAKWVGKCLRVLFMENDFPTTVKGILRVFVAYSVPITLASGLQYATNIIDAANTKLRLLAAGFEPGQATAMYGYVSKYQQIINVPMIIVIALGSTVLPKLSSAKVLHDMRDFKNSLVFAYRWCFIVTIPIAVGIFVLGEPIYATIKYGVGGDLLSMSAIIVVFMGITQIQSSILQGMGRLYAMSMFLTIGLASKIIINYFVIAIPEVNIYGTVIGSVVCYLVTAVMGQLYIKKHQQRVRVPILRYIIKPLIASLAMGLCVWASFQGIFFVEGLFMGDGYLKVAIPTLLSVVIGVIVFVVVFYFLGGIKEKDLDMLPDGLRRRIPQKLYKRIQK